MPVPTGRRALVALRAVAVGGALALALAATACASDGADRSAPAATSDRSDPSDPMSRGATMPMTDLQTWTGFASTPGLELVAADETQGIDRLVRLAFRGSPDAVDRALAAAGLTAAFRPGVKVFEPALDTVDLAALTEPSSANDTWKNAEGRTLTRKVVRGTVAGADGDQLIHIWAFTT